MKKIILIAVIATCFGFTSVAQKEAKTKTNAEIVMSIYDSKEIKEIKVMQLGDGFNKEYSGKWLTEVSIEDGFLKVSKDKDNSHYWDLKKAVLIEVNTDILIIRLGY